MSDGSDTLKTIITSGAAGMLTAIIVGYIIEKLKNK